MYILGLETKSFAAKKFFLRAYKIKQLFMKKQTVIFLRRLIYIITVDTCILRYAHLKNIIHGFKCVERKFSKICRVLRLKNYP